MAVLSSCGIRSDRTAPPSVPYLLPFLPQVRHDPRNEFAVSRVLGKPRDEERGLLVVGVRGSSALGRGWGRRWRGLRGRGRGRGLGGGLGLGLGEAGGGRNIINESRGLERKNKHQRDLPSLLHRAPRADVRLLASLTGRSPLRLSYLRSRPAPRASVMSLLLTVLLALPLWHRRSHHDDVCSSLSPTRSHPTPYQGQLPVVAPLPSTLISTVEGSATYPPQRLSRPNSEHHSLALSVSFILPSLPPTRQTTPGTSPPHRPLPPHLALTLTRPPPHTSGRPHTSPAPPPHTPKWRHPSGPYRPSAGSYESSPGPGPGGRRRVPKTGKRGASRSGSRGGGSAPRAAGRGRTTAWRWMEGGWGGRAISQHEGGGGGIRVQGRESPPAAAGLGSSREGVSCYGPWSKENQVQERPGPEEARWAYETTASPTPALTPIRTLTVNPTSSPDPDLRNPNR